MPYAQHVINRIVFAGREKAAQFKYINIDVAFSL